MVVLLIYSGACLVYQSQVAEAEEDGALLLAALELCIAVLSCSSASRASAMPLISVK